MTHMKFKFLAVLAAVAVLVGAAPVLAEEAEIKVVVNGQSVVFDQSPVIVENRTLVPLRAIFEALGARVDWNSETRTVFAKKRFDTVSLEIGQNVLYKNGETVALDVPAQLVNDRTLVPVRAISEAFDLLVQWDAQARTVTVESMPEERNITDHYIEGGAADVEFGVELVQATCAYPQIENPDNNAVIAELNKTLLEKAEAYIEAAKLQGVDRAVEAYKQSQTEGIPFTTFEYERAFDITYNTNNILAVVEVMTETVLAGGGTATTITAATYDLTTGNEMDASDFSTQTPEVINNVATVRFGLLQIDSPELYLENAAETINAGGLAFVTFPTKIGLAFCLQPDVIASAAAGVQYIVIQYQDDAEFFKQDYAVTATDDQYIYELMKQVGAPRGWNRSELSFNFEGNSSMEIGNTICRAISVTRKVDGAEVGKFAVSPDLRYLFEYDAQANQYNEIR